MILITNRLHNIKIQNSKSQIPSPSLIILIVRNWKFGNWNLKNKRFIPDFIMKLSYPKNDYSVIMSFCTPITF